LQQEKLILAAMPDADVEGEQGRPSSFEVIVDDTLVAYSKLTTGQGKFPDFAALAKEIAAYAASKQVPASWAVKR
jgi:hypothetical protein